MHGRHFLRNQIVSLAFLSCVFFCHASVTRAQVPEPPVLPMDIKFRYVPLYFEQSFTDDLRYARIAALVDGDRCDVILFDKTTELPQDSELRIAADRSSFVIRPFIRIGATTPQVRPELSRLIPSRRSVQAPRLPL